MDHSQGKDVFGEGELSSGICYPSPVTVTICCPCWRTENDPGVQISIFHVTLSQLGGTLSLTWFMISFAVTTICRDVKTLAETTMTLGFIFHLSCFSIAVLQNWSCAKVFVGGMYFFQ